MNILIPQNELNQLFEAQKTAILSEMRQLLGIMGKASRNLNAKQAADFLGISISTLYKSLHRIPHKRFGKKLLFSEKELEEIRH
jgi:excisionase family DNA binding protein